MPARRKEGERAGKKERRDFPVVQGLRGLSGSQHRGPGSGNQISFATTYMPQLKDPTCHI